MRKRPIMFSQVAICCSLQVFGNIEGLVGLFTLYSWSDIYQIVDSINFDNVKAIGKDKDEVVDSGKLLKLL